MRRLFFGADPQKGVRGRVPGGFQRRSLWPPEALSRAGRASRTGDSGPRAAPFAGPQPPAARRSSPMLARTRARTPARIPAVPTHPFVCRQSALFFAQRAHRLSPTSREGWQGTSGPLPSRSNPAACAAHPRQFRRHSRANPRFALSASPKRGRFGRETPSAPAKRPLSRREGPKPSPRHLSVTCPPARRSRPRPPAGSSPPSAA